MRCRLATTESNSVSQYCFACPLTLQRTVRLVTFRMEDRPERRGVSGGCPDAPRVLKALKLTDLKPPTPPEGKETLM